MFLEGNGGGNGIESYELAAYFYARHVNIKKAELPFFFITGDELMYDTISAGSI